LMDHQVEMKEVLEEFLQQLKPQLNSSLQKKRKSSSKQTLPKPKLITRLNKKNQWSNRKQQNMLPLFRNQPLSTNNTLKEHP